MLLFCAILFRFLFIVPDIQATFFVYLFLLSDAFYAPFLLGASVFIVFYEAECVLAIFVAG